jgi:tRNA(Arg) A34 adenosine deaminase TadA
MCAAALAQVGIGMVCFGCCNERFGGCGSVMHLHGETEDDSMVAGAESSDGSFGHQRESPRG